MLITSLVGPPRCVIISWLYHVHDLVCAHIMFLRIFKLTFCLILFVVTIYSLWISNKLFTETQLVFLYTSLLDLTTDHTRTLAQKQKVRQSLRA